MTSNNTGIYLECLYTEADESLKDRFAAHLEVLRKAGFIDGIHYQHIKEYPGIESDRLAHTDIYIFLVSADLLASEFMQSIKLKEILDLNDANFLELVLVLLRPCDLEQSIFSEADFFPNNNEAVISEYWHNADQAFLAVADELKVIAEDRRVAKGELEGDWKRTQGSRNVKVYDNFLKNHPDSKYSPQARDEKDLIREEQLWVKVSRNSNMDTLFKYLQQAPLQDYREEALDRIIQIRKDEETSWKDAKNSEEVAFYMEYRQRFPEGTHVSEAEQWIEDFMLTPFDYNEQQICSQRHYLKKLALEELNPKEYLSMDMCVRYVEYTKKVLKKAVATLKGRVSILQMLAYTLVFGMIVFVLLWYYYTGPDEIDIPTLIRYFIPIALVSMIATTIMGITQMMQRDLERCKAELEDLERTKVMLEISFILHDKRTISRVLKELFASEEWSNAINRKEIQDYFGLGKN